MKLFVRVGFAIVSAIACTTFSALVQAEQATPPDTATFIRLMRAENALNVGKTLPAGIQVVNAEGNTVDLRAALHGPVVVLRIDPACTPCEQLLDYVRANAVEYMRSQHTSIAVLRTKDSGHAALSLPQMVTELHTKDGLDGGFLAGKIAPTAYFFDGELRLLARRGGMTTAEEFMRFPAVH